MDIAVLGIDLGKNVCSVVRIGRGRPSPSAASPEAASGGRVCSPIPGLRRGDGSVLRCASSGAAAGDRGARGSLDVAGICPPICQGTEE
jgi:hypothetical protein